MERAARELRSLVLDKLVTYVIKVRVARLPNHFL